MTPYYSDESATIYHGDCREIAPQLGIFDFVWTDPPYNVGKDYGTHNDSMPIEDYFRWCEEWISVAKSAADRVGVYPPKIHLRWFWNQLPENHPVIVAWSPEGAIRGGYVHQYAPLLLPQKPLNRCKDHWWNIQIPGLGYFFREENFGHPGYTSEDITSRVLSAFCNPGMSVLDLFLGTGTTLRCAKDRGIKGVGIEIEEKYCEIAAKRMAQEAFMFTPEPKLKTPELAFAL